jgi:hypothetical protein
MYWLGKSPAPIGLFLVFPERNNECRTLNRLDYRYANLGNYCRAKIKNVATAVRGGCRRETSQKLLNLTRETSDILEAKQHRLDGQASMTIYAADGSIATGSVTNFLATLT